MVDPDSVDVGSAPEASPAVGTVTFTARPPIFRDVAASPDAVTLIPRPVVVALDVNGYIVDGQGAQGVQLIATDDADLNPSAWTWQVSFNLTGATIPSFDFQLPQGTTVNLTAVMPIQASNGVFYLPGGIPNGGDTDYVLTKNSPADQDVSWQANSPGGGGGGNVNSVNGDTGPSVVLDAADIAETGTRKWLTDTERTKLTGVAQGATANSTDAALRDRTTHTGVQAVSTISGLQTTLDDIVTQEADDYALLNAQVAGKQPLDADLTAIAALTTTSYGRALLEIANQAALQAVVGLVVGTNVQAFDADLAAIAGLTSAANKIIRYTGAGTAGLLDFSTDVTLAANSDLILSSQKALKAYIDSVDKDRIVACKSVAGAWVTASGGAVPTDPNLIRFFISNDPTIATPTGYSDYDHYFPRAA
jgi:hypothetical protein